jgi:tRNAHis guanylyltransferase
MKPNDHRGLELMDHAAVDLMREFPDVIFGFGQSDEFRYVYLIPRHANPAINLPSVFSFANPRQCTTDADQKLRRLCALISQLRTL